MRKKTILILPAAVLLIVMVIIAFSGREYPIPAGTASDAATPEVADHIRMLLGGGHGDESNWEDVLTELSARPDAVGFAALLALADTAQAGGEEAEEYLRRALLLHDSRDVRWRLAVLLKEKNDVPAARSEFLKLLPDPLSLEELLLLNTHPETVLAVLADGGHWQAVLDVLNDSRFLAGKDSEPRVYQAFRARALAMLDRYTEALPYLADLISQGYDEANMTWLYARSLEAADYREKAISLYIGLGPAGARRLGRLYELSGKKAMAAAAYEKSSEAAALWRGAVLWEELGYTDRAIALYRQISGTPGPHQDDALFRSYQLLGRTDAEKTAEILPGLKTHPAWMNRLGLQPDWPEPGVLDKAEPELTDRLNLYRLFGRDDLVQVDLAIARRRATAEEKISIGQWHLRNSDYREAVRWGSRALRTLKAKEAYELAYPRPFSELVEKAAAEYNLDTKLIWAVMREESLFQPQAVSRVGALGLMQIMPATGQEIARSLRMELNEADLLSPGVNIRFGAYYLRRMLDLFDGDLDLALAAYNGGPGNVNNWRESLLGRQPDGFYTAITFFETREYITKVMNSYLTYQWLYEN